MRGMSAAATLWTAAEATAVTGGCNSLDWCARGVSIDSRTIAPGDLFVALKGPVHDGHDFAVAARDRGAAAVLARARPAGLGPAAPLLLVNDTMTALYALARAARSRTDARIVAVTGSAGKTGTKEALRRVLADQGPTGASFGSFNNHWGVPLSLARLPADAAYGVFEVGMNHAGEILPLSRLIRPHVALITNVGSAHIEHFDSVEAIADAKAEIFAGVPGDGTAILNRDNPHFERLARAARERGLSDIVAFGADSRADARLIACDAGSEASDVTARIHGEEIRYRVGIPGRHWALNSLAVLAAARALGADLAAAARGLAGLEALDGRGRTHRLRCGKGEIRLIDESYNANPASMRAAIETLGGARPAAEGRCIAVVGSMLELGRESAKRHAEVAETLERCGVDLVFAAGEMREAYRRLPRAMQGAAAESGDALAGQVTQAVRPGDVVMVKGSNASGMKKVVDALLRRRPAAAGKR